MEEDYDRKFEDMKKYIPFLDTMIKRLQSSSSGPGKPRLAQLFKIKALRDLLLDKSKRMKMDNLLKCEQVLVNLYAKVEQKEILNSIDRPKEKCLESAREKLKVLSIQRASDDEQDTLPEIARADQVEVVCSPGSKEPALFQRRPNKLSPPKSSPKEGKTISRRNYTRVLVSPEPSPHRKSESESREREKRLYQRRSPKRTPVKSPSQQKRKSRRDSDKGQRSSRDVNILLQVPQKSLKGLNTANIGERIMNCDDQDVDLHTLKEIRSKIISELKKSGSNDDISDIIMKSYNIKDAPKQKTSEKKTEIEDGEISDSESETIDHVYGNLSNENDIRSFNEKGAQISNNNEGDSRKIQICFVLSDPSKNPPKSKSTTVSTAKTNDVIDLDELDLNPNVTEKASKLGGLQADLKDSTPEPTLTIDLLNDKEDLREDASKEINIAPKLPPTSSPHSTETDILNITKSKIQVTIPKVIESRKANFYTPLVEYDELQQDEKKAAIVEGSIKNTSEAPVTTLSDLNTSPKKAATKSSNLITSPIKALPLANEIISLALEQISDKSTPVIVSNDALKAIESDNINNLDKTFHSSSLKIPFISDVSENSASKESVVSELDILQALKNDILSEPINIPNTETPTLHQPKLTKVTDVKEITKKKISLDKYKEKAFSSKSLVKNPVFNTPINLQNQSRGLTEKECERFKLPCRLSLDDEYSSEDEPNSKRSPSPTGTIYGHLAPQSPDAQPHADESSNAPVIIPAEPLKPPVASTTDIDMRTLPLSNKELIKPNVIKDVTIATSEKKSPRPNDPRLRKDVLTKLNEKIGSPNIMISGTAPLPVPSPFSASSSPFSNMTPCRTPSSRAFEIGTPSHQTFDLSESNRSKKHVYAPSFVSHDTSEFRESSIVKEPGNNINVWDKNDKYDALQRDGSKTSRTKWEDGRNVRREEEIGYERSSHRDYYKDRHIKSNYERSDYRDNYPSTPVHSFGRSDAPMTPVPSFGRSEVPTTPLPSYGRSEAPMTPLPSFGRSEAPTTPKPSFGRSDTHGTPLLSFGHPERSSATIHPYGRPEMPKTPSHPFGRSDYAPSTPSHPFGRADYQKPSSHTYGKSHDNRVTRSDYDSTGINRNATNYNRNPYGSEKFSYSRNDRYDKRDIYSRRHDSKTQSPERCVGRNLSRDEYLRDSIRRHVGNDEYHHSRFKDYHHGSNKPNNRYDNESNKFQHESRRHRFEMTNRPSHGSTRGVSRRPSVGHYDQKSFENTVSVEADAGRSFTIDTSVNATFQGFDKNILNNISFDVRRQRAASVGRVNMRENSIGRSFLREANVGKKYERGSSVGRSLNSSQEGTFQKGYGRALAEAFVPSFNKHFYGNKPINKFSRAQSVGRDLDERSSKTFAETKAEFMSYKDTSYEKHSKDKNTYQVKKDKDLKKDLQNRNDVIINKGLRIDKNEPYSPRKNLRDPRMKQRHQDKYHVDHRPLRNPRDKAFGIVYSNDNIAKGNVIGPGVKNYKIPKIKKPIEEASGQDSDTNKSENLKSSDSETTKIKNIEPGKKKSNNNGGKFKVSNVEELIRNDNKKSSCKVEFNSKNSKQPKQDKEDDNETLLRRSRTQKKGVYDSDSDEDKVQQNKKIAEKSNVPISKENVPFDSLDDISLDFENDDVFTYNRASDDVIDNIDSIIADLEKETGNEIEGDISKDKVFDSLFENIDQNESLSTKDKTEKSSLDVIISNDIRKEHGNAKNILSTSENSLKTVANEIQLQSSETPLAKTQEQNICSPQNIISNTSEKIATPDLALKTKYALPKLAPADSPQKITLALPILATPDSPQKSRMFAPKLATLDSPQKTATTSPKLATSDSPQETSTAITNVLRSPNEGNQINNEAKVADHLSEASQVKSIFLVTTSAESEPHKTVASSKTGSDDQENCDVINFTPDSTIENDVINSKNGEGQDPEAEETSLAHPENMNPIVSSTLNDQSVKESNGGTDAENKNIGKISSIISLLQDVNSVEEMLSSIGNQQEREKLKKKLEKLSKLISEDDDDDVNDISNIVEETSKKNEKPENQLEEQNQSEVLQEKMDGIHQSDTPLDKINDQPDNDSEVPIPQVSKKPGGKKTKLKRKGIAKRKKKKVMPKQATKRITRSGATKIPKKANRELKKLHDDIRDMFMSKDVMNATGIRMCRLVKLPKESASLAEQDNDFNKTKSKSISQKEEFLSNSDKPLVVIEKIALQQPEITKPPRKKPGPKPKLKPLPKPTEEIKAPPKRKPGPKSKTKYAINKQNDPYDFESDSMSEATTKASENSAPNSSSDSENDSIASSSTSVGSSELLIELKTKHKRRRGGWQSGVIRHTKKKAQTNSDKQGDSHQNSFLPLASIETPPKIPDYDCFTDIRYSFEKNKVSYPCRLCIFEGENIVGHYKNNHPHYEIPLSRLKQNVAKEAIKQSMVTNFQKISNVPLQKYVCRFCNITFDDKRKPLLETFFWHVVSNHTGEYKQLCSECLNTKSCTFMLDIPPPPKNLQGLLMGYICGKCFYTQVSLENLKNHVSLRHNDEETEVYTISLATITQQMAESMQCAAIEDTPRTLRNSKQFAPTDSQENSGKEENTQNNQPISVQSKIHFENDHENNSIKSESESDSEGKTERLPDKTCDHTISNLIPNEDAVTNDIVEHAHLKINISSTGVKEYICAATGGDDHYKTTLLISIKQHVQRSHATQNWDGYCYFCKVIVMPQGRHSYKDCLAHFLDKHLEDGIVKDKPAESQTPESMPENMSNITKAPTPPPKSYISVKPISQLLSISAPPTEITSLDAGLPKIQSVVSLNSEVIEEPTIPLPVSVNNSVPYIESVQKDVARKPILEYEESLKLVMSNKYRIALDTMLTDEKLSHVFKCASRYCSFTCDSPEDALIHCSTHLRKGCNDALKCSYCSFDCSGDYIELVSHVFKDHGNCMYSCTSCFYRGRTVAMVENHCQIAHDSARKCAVVSSIVVAPSQSVILPRKDAVKMYACFYGEGTGKMCNFKTATPDKFCCHLSSDHPDLTTYRCSECAESTASPALLIDHLSQKHQLKSFQCSRCVFGAETRIDILTHCSIKHPIEVPQAYWRKIITKDGAAPKVLPLVSLSGPALFNTVEPIPTQKSDPVREAERADALEKLVGVTLQVTGSSTPDLDLSEDILEADDLAADEPLDLPIEEPILSSAAPSEPNPTLPPAETCIADRATPILKKEPTDDTDVKPMTSAHIISLDSEDEHANQPEAGSVIELSDSDGEISVVQNTKRVPGPRLRACDVYACRKCKNHFKNAAGLKRHLLYCYSTGEQLNCAHCADVFMCTNTLVKHMKFVHGPEEKFVCGVCNAKDTEATKMRNHLNSIHNVTKFIVNMVVSDDNLTITNIFKPESSLSPPVAKRGPKRKRSATTQAFTPPKVKKYAPEEIDALPKTQIFDGNAYCSLCEFNTKVRSNMVRHLQAHAQKQPDLPEIAPVNPVPHLETNEMHFDRMVNLASSSITTRAPEQSNRSEQMSTITVHVPLSVAARYPKYVPERKRYVCGAKDCKYLSINEDMLICHWETLHSGSNDYHCVHCPETQQLKSPTASITTSRIIAHFKMHDMRLYACSECTYYHHLTHLVEKHIGHKHKTGCVKIVREPVTGPLASTSTVPIPGPTMDLKPWQCGLCKFNDMLRPKVVEHCARHHNSKFQFKCTYCPWRSSAMENVVKHHLTSHQQHKTEVFYFYYQEGSLPEIDGKPVWVIQKENSNTPDVKEDPEPVPEIVSSAEKIEVNVDLVKKEPVDGDERNSDSLCMKYGPLCEPNGLLYKCPFCKVAAENDKVSMQSHLFEELKYRRWACNICSYKAFHKQGLKDHAAREHKGMQENSTELPQDIGIESWVALLLNHQDTKIAENLAKVNNMAATLQKTSTVTQPEVSSAHASKPHEQSSKSDFTNHELEKAFGSFGAPINMMFSCPKCEFKTKNESKMSEHLEMELTKVRWCCNLCTEKYTTYHMAQLHCRTAHTGAAAKALEALRDPEARHAWPLAVIAVQKLSMNVMPFTADPNLVAETENNTPSVNNDLLVARYEENVLDPDCPGTSKQATLDAVAVTSDPVPAKRKRPGFLGELDSDDENLIIDERPSKKQNPIKKPQEVHTCPYCKYTTKADFLLNIHILAHYNLKTFSCGHCNLSDRKAAVIKHLKLCHPDKPETILKTIIPSYPPKPQKRPVKNKPQVKMQPESAPSQKESELSKILLSSQKDKVFICLICEQEVLETATQNHVHPNEPPQYAKKGDLILKCTSCSVLKNNLPAMKLHHSTTHSAKNLDYVYTKLLPENTGALICKVTGCGRKFVLMEDLKKHYLESHATDPLSFTITPSASHSINKDEQIDESVEDETNATGVKRKSETHIKVVAKKSTSKLPSISKIAKKSTTKLPLLYVEESDSAEEGFSFYGSKPAPLEQYSNVKTHMPFMNTVMPFTVNKLKDIVDIAPKILVKKVPDP